MANETSIQRDFAFEKFLPWWCWILLAVALFAFSWWMARQDARYTDRKWVVRTLTTLRTIAIMVLLWMLAGPAWVTTLRTFKNKVVAILVDRSASMGLVDGLDGSGNVIRWSAARTGDPQTRSLRELDQAVSLLAAVQRQLDRFSKVPVAADSTRERAELSRAAQGLQTGVMQLRTAAEGIEDRGDTPRSALLNLTENLSGTALETLRQRAAEFSSGKSLAGLEREQWLPDSLAAIADAVQQADRLIDQYARRLEETAARAAGDAMAGETTLSRLDKTEAFLAAAESGWLKEIRARATVSRYEFGDKVIPLGTSPWSEPSSNAPGKDLPLWPSTRIGNALQQVALDSSAQPVDAVVLITDGGNNAGRDPRELAPALASAPLHIVPIGNTKMQRDVILHHTHAPKAVLKNDRVLIDSMVTAYQCVGEKLEVELLDNDRVVDRQTVPVTSEVFDTRIQLQWRADQLGKHNLAMRVLPVGEERSADNNASKSDIHVLEDNLRIFVADNFPRWETRYLLNLFKRDDRISFEQVLFEPRHSRGARPSDAFPRTLEEWSKYRVVILGDLLPAQLSAEQQKLLHEYVSKAGGNLVLIAGKDAMPGAYFDQPLSTLLPVEAGRRPLPGNAPFYLHLADEGSMTLATQIADSMDASDRIWRETSERLPIYALSEFSKPKATSHSLLWASASRTSFDPSDDNTRSFLAWHYVGSGRVVYIAAPVTYQLRYRTGDTFHHRFWGQLLRWAVARDLGEGSRTVRLATDKSRYEEGESTEVSVRLSQLDGTPVSGAALQVSAMQDNRFLQEVTVKEDSARPGLYRGVLEQLPIGPVKLQVSGERSRSLLAAEGYARAIETTVTIDPSDSLELRHPLCNLPLLREIADASGGGIVPATGLGAAMKQINLDPETLEHVTRLPLWNRWDLFWIFIICLSLEWAGRKHLGLS